MGMGALATIGVMQPANLAIMVFDNGLYGETGMQQSHSARGADLAGIAQACGIGLVHQATTTDELGRLAALLHQADRTLFARIAIAPSEPPRVLPTRDGVHLKLRFRRALGVAPQ
jgi:thiamine pyrophosphate-dependent acetolactate synthase large subunit-like protein